MAEIRFCEIKNERNVIVDLGQMIGNDHLWALKFKDETFSLIWKQKDIRSLF
jgi:hypothetical protein